MSANKEAQPLRILHVITGLGRGGAEAMMIKVIEEHQRQGITVGVISLSRELTLLPQLNAMNVIVHSWKLPRGVFSFGLWKFFYQWYHQESLPWTVIQGWMYHGNLVATLLWFFGGRQVKLVWNIRQSLNHYYREKRLTRVIIELGAWLSSYPARIIYNSSVAQGQHEELGYEKDKSILIGNGFSLEKFKSVPEHYELMRESWRIEKKSRVFGTVGRWHADKDYPTFVAAALKSLQVNSNLYFVFIGKGLGVESPAVDLIDRKFASHFIFLGETDKVSEWMQGFDYYVSSSAAEAFSNSIGEAMACEIPCIVTDVGHSSKIIGETGWLVPAQSVQALSDAMLRAAQVSEGELKSQGKKARARIEKEFGIKAIADKYLELYQG
jgi:glycosyltransferase involved in cell wall biosynthesis